MKTAMCWLTVPEVEKPGIEVPASSAGFLDAS